MRHVHCYLKEFTCLQCPSCSSCLGEGRSNTCWFGNWSTGNLASWQQIDTPASFGRLYSMFLFFFLPCAICWSLTCQLLQVSAYSSFTIPVAGGISLEQQRRRMDPSTNEPLFTNCTRDFIGTVDYIFHTGEFSLFSSRCLPRWAIFW